MNASRLEDNPSIKKPYEIIANIIGARKLEIEKDVGGCIDPDLIFCKGFKTRINKLDELTKIIEAYSRVRES